MVVYGKNLGKPMQQRSWSNDLYGDHNGPILVKKDGVDVIDCEFCGFAHIVPLPNPETQAKFYEGSFYQEEKPSYLEEADEDFAWKEVECKLRYSVVADLLGKKPGRMLDIGCGPGDFLKVGQDLDWQCLGIEPSQVAVAHARQRGLEVIEGFFSPETAGDLGKFDFIHLSEVLEHVAEPKQLLILAEQLLTPGGVLCVSTPNDFNPLQGAVLENFDSPSWWVVPDHHLNYFTFESLGSLIETAGLKVEQKLTNFPMEMFLLMGQDYTTNPKLGRQLHAWRKNLDINLSAANDGMLKAFYSGLAGMNMGRLAIVFAQKNDAGQ